MPYSAPGFVIYNERPCLQSDSIKFDIDAHNKSVETLLLGYAGHSAGSLEVTVEVSNPIPQDGLEVPWDEIVIAQQEVDIGFKIGGRTYNCRGNIGKTGFTTGVNDANKNSMSFTGRIVGLA